MSIADERRATLDEAVERAKTFQMFDPEMKEPWTALKAFREQCPVARSEAFDGYWILSKRDDAQKALANQAHFSTAQVTIPKVEDPLGRRFRWSTTRPSTSAIAPTSTPSSRPRRSPRRSRRCASARGATSKRSRRRAAAS